MDALPWYVVLPIILVCIIVSMLFTSAENAFSSCNIYHYKVLSEENLKARLIFKMADKFDNTIVTVLIGFNLMQAIVSNLSAILFLYAADYYNWATGIESIVSTIVVTIVVYFIDDYLPKIISKVNPDKTVEFVIYPIYFFYILFYPISLFFRGFIYLVKKIFKSKEDLKITKEEFIDIASEAEDEVLENNEKQLIKKALLFDNVSVKDVLSPKDKIVSISTKDLTVKKVNALIQSISYSRIPVYEGDDKDSIIGILVVKTYFNEYVKDNHLSIKSILSDVVKVNIDDKVDDIFKKFNDEKSHFGLVYDNENKLVGMITMDDILEELVGDVQERFSEVKDGEKHE